MKFLSCILVHDGILSRHQLITALEQQVISGSDLPSIYLELGYMDEKTLLGYLEQRYRLPGKGRADFDRANEALIGFPEMLIWKYRVFPLLKQHAVLHLGMVDPSDRAARLAISRTTGTILKPYVITKVTLDYLIERYLGRPTKKSEKFALSGGPLAAISPLAWAKSQLESAADPAAVTAIILQYLSCYYERCQILLLRGGRLRPWQNSGFDRVTLESVPKALELNDKPELKAFLAEAAPFIGSLSDPHLAALVPLLKATGNNQNCAICPLSMSGRVVQLFYLDNGPGKPLESSHLGEVTLVLSQAAAVYEALLRKAVEEHMKEIEQSQ